MNGRAVSTADRRCGHIAARRGRWFGALAAALTALVWALPAAAQTAPAGNAHPETHALSDETGGEANPFGEPSAPSGFDPERKRAFSREVDLEPLRDLAVFHTNRVKILDTLARETVRNLTGRKNYLDFVSDAEEGQKPNTKRVGYDPLFTFLDMIIDPAYYEDKALIHIGYLPLREAFLKEAFPRPEEMEALEWWKRQGRLSPLMISQFAPAVIAAYQSPSAHRRGPEDLSRAMRGLDEVSGAMGLYRFGWRNLLMVAPSGHEQEWLHLSTLGAADPAASAARELGEAWRAGDAARVNAAAATLAGALPAINAPMYPTFKRGLERVYNASNAFEYGYWMYCLSLLSLLLAFGTGRRWLRVTGFVFLAAAVGLHAFGFIARCIIAERFAIQNQFESMTGLSLFAAVVGVAIMLLRRQTLFGAAAAGVGFLVLITATQTGIPGVRIEREAAILNTSVLLKYHVTTVLVSYGLISLGFIISLFYLGTHYAARLGRGGEDRTRADSVRALNAVPGAAAVEVSAHALGLEDDQPQGPRRVLADLDRAQMIVLQLAFWTLAVGILLGAWWADHSWGRWWGFDPKEVWALVTWIVYLVVIHLRFATGGNRARVTAWLSVLGFFVMLWTYFGVNLLLPGLHAYA